VRDVLYVACERGIRMYREVISGSSPTNVQTFFNGTYGRLRTVEPAPDGGPWLSNSSGDKDSTPHTSNDVLLHVQLGSGWTSRNRGAGRASGDSRPAVSASVSYGPLSRAPAHIVAAGIPGLSNRGSGRWLSRRRTLAAAAPGGTVGEASRLLGVLGWHGFLLVWHGVHPLQRS
jgi:hypothetical protein